MKKYMDHCRIGSLENREAHIMKKYMDHCRIGSLEIQDVVSVRLGGDHCRIGSLESSAPWMRSLPHRQLRNGMAVVR